MYTELNKAEQEKIIGGTAIITPDLDDVNLNGYTGPSLLDYLWNKVTGKK